MRAPSVSGIGNVGMCTSCRKKAPADRTVEKPDMSEAKIVVAMVGQSSSQRILAKTNRLDFQLEANRISVTSSCDTYE